MSLKINTTKARRLKISKEISKTSVLFFKMDLDSQIFAKFFMDTDRKFSVC
jgi:hypothetical protein